MQHQTNDQMTLQRRQELEEEWINKVMCVNSAVSEANTIDEYLAKLNDVCQWNSFRFWLWRWIYRNCSNEYIEQEDCSKEFTLKGAKKAHVFSAVTVGKTPNETDIEELADYLFEKTKSNRCFRIDHKTGRLTKDFAISKLFYKNYLGGSLPTREMLFRISIALKLSAKDVGEMFLAAGELPYQFRNYKECIYYFCNSCREHCNMDTVAELLQQYEARKKKAKRSGTKEGETQLIHEVIDKVVEGSYSLEDARKKALIDSLVRQSDKMVGHSRVATRVYRELWEKLRAAVKRTYPSSMIPLIIGFGSKEDNDDSVLKALVRQYILRYVRESDYDRVENDQISTDLLSRLTKSLSELMFEGDEELSKYLLETSSLWQYSRGERVTVGQSDLLDEYLPYQSHIVELLSGKKAVKKREILFLYFHLYVTELMDVPKTRKDRLNQMLRFKEEVDAILQEAHLEMTYYAHPFDNFIFASLCTVDPENWLSSLIEKARGL